MKFNRILSSVLAVVMLFSTIAFVIPVKADAASDTVIRDTNFTVDEAKVVISAYQKASFESAEEMFEYDNGLNYLSYTKNGDYGIYVNKYTGVMYYRNEKTGQLLTSNSYNFANVGGTDALTSQVTVTYAPITDTEKVSTLHSSTWAAMFKQITITEIEGGLRVSYAIGDTAERCLLPVMIKAETFEEEILKPMFKLLYDTTVENLGFEYAIDFFRNASYYTL